MTQTTQFSHLTITAGRILLALYFLIPGIMKFLAFPAHVDMMTQGNVPFPVPLLLIAGVAQVLGAIMLLTNRHVRFASLGFVVYIVLINLMLHDFWTFSGAAARHELQNFIKNFGILAGLLVLAGASPSRKFNPRTLFQNDKRGR